MVIVLILAIVLFLVGIFTAKMLWWAALLFAIVWLVGFIRSGHRIPR